MGYKHSPANAKLSAFMQKMNNTSKSPARQNKSEYDLRRNADLDAQSNMAQTSSNVVTSKPRITTGTDSKGDFTTTEYDVTTTNKFQGTGTDKDAWDKNKDGVKGKYSNFKEFSKAAQAYRDKMTKSTEKISKTEYKDKPKEEKPKASNVSGVQKVRADVMNSNKVYVGAKENPKYDIRYDAKYNREVLNQERTIPVFEDVKYKKGIALGETIPEGADVNMVGLKEGLNENIVQDKVGVTRNMKLRDDQNLKNLENKKSPVEMKRHSDRFASPAKQGHSGKNFRPSKETRKDIKEAKKKQKDKIKHAQKTGTETTDLYAKDVVFKVGMPKGVDSF